MRFQRDGVAGMDTGNLVVSAQPAEGIRMLCNIWTTWCRQTLSGKRVDATAARPVKKLFHLHVLADMLEPILGFDGCGFIELHNQIWPMLVERAASDKIGTGPWKAIEASASEKNQFMNHTKGRGSLSVLPLDVP